MTNSLLVCIGKGVDRIEGLRRRLSTVPLSEMCFERARLMTESYRETEGEPVITQRAKALYKILDGMPLVIDEINRKRARNLFIGFSRR